MTKVVTYVSTAVVFVTQAICLEHTLSVYTGDQTVLQCSVTALLPQWRKQTETGREAYSNLGHRQINPALPHADRLSINENGNLVINDTQRSDAGTYFCSDTEKSIQIELKVNVKPYLPAISNIIEENGRFLIRAKEDHNVTLTCKSVGGLPKPNVKWTTASTDLFSTEKIDEASDGTYNVTIEHIFTARRSNDRLTYSCKTELTGHEDLVSSVMLYLYLKPLQPKITGPKTIMERSIGIYQCKTSGCRPQASIVWKYNGSTISTTVSSSYNSEFETYTVESNYSSGILQRIDNSKSLVCVVSNKALPAAIEESHSLNITFSPVRVTLSGNVQIVADGVNTLNLTCRTSTANPAATLHWLRDEKPIRSGINRLLLPGNYGGKEVSEKLTFNPTRSMDGDKISCVFNTDVMDETTLDLHYNPVTTINGTLHRTVHEGKRNLSFLCSAESKPVSTFTWYHNGDLVDRSNGQQATNQYSYILKEVTRRNFGNYTCEADNTVSPSTNDTQTLTVLFPPETVTLSGNAQIVANGVNTLELTCTAGTANPVAALQWYQGHETIRSNITKSILPGDFGGKKALEKLTLRPTRNMDGNIISCAFNSEVKDETALNMTYSTIISVPRQANATEGERNVAIRCSASSKPPSRFKWFKNGKDNPVHVSNGSVDNNLLEYTISVVNRTDGGQYRCEADNGVGTPDATNSVLELNVYYPPDVYVNATNATINDSAVYLLCSASGNPSIYSYKEWTQTWPGHGSILKTFSSTRLLKLTNLSYQHTGMYHCAAGNGIKLWNTQKQFIEGSAFLFVKSYPIITFPDLQDSQRHRVPAALNKNFTVLIRLYSNDDMASQLTVTLFDNSSDTVNDSITKMNEGDITLKVRDHSVSSRGIHLNVTHTVFTEDEFGMFFIQITNNIGATVFPFEVIPEGPPCSPKNADVESTNKRNIIIAWTRCFHGGFAQTFVAQFHTDGSDWVNRTTVYGGLSRKSDRLNATVDSLQPDTRYYIRLYSYNVKGMSNYTYLEATTQPEGTSEKTSIGLVVGGVVGGVAAAAIIILFIVLFLRRYKRTQESPSKRLLKKDNERPAGTSGADDTPEINLNPMYESAGPLSSTSNSDVYSQVDKKRKKAKPTGEIYSQVGKPNKRQNCGGPEVKNDVYAQVQKKSHKEKDAGKIIHKQKQDKKATKGKQREGEMYDNVDTVNATATIEGTVYENPSCSLNDEYPKQMRNQDGLVYADLDLPKETVGKDRKAVIHGLDDRTDYADIKFGEVGKQAPESDDENKQE